VAANDCGTIGEGVVNGLLLDGLMLILALFLVALNGFFVAAEFALVKIRSTQVDRLVREGKTSAHLVEEAINKLDAYLSVSQLGITISSLGLGWIGEPAFAHFLQPLLEPLGVPEGSIHVIAFAAAFGTITFLHVVFGELAPKSLAIARAERIALFVAPFMKFFYFVFWPGIVVFNGMANAVVRLFGVPPASETEETHSEEELRIIIEQSTRQGVLNTGEEHMLEAVFELENTRVREIMVPRPDVVALPAAMKLEEMVSVTAGGHTRYPVFEGGSPDRIVGMIHVKDILEALKKTRSLEADVRARDIMRDVLIIPENRRIDELLKDMQKQGVQIAVVIDEWGSFEGIVTIEDMVEEIVGEIREEFGEEEPHVERREDGSYVVDGRIPISEVNEVAGSSFESEDFDTIGGLVLGQLGHTPEVGDEVHLDGYRLRVEEVDGSRVVLVSVKKDSRE
jgi:CBS domain containing-hemolysin-like protein